MRQFNFATLISFLCLAVIVVIGWQCAKQLESPTSQANEQSGSVVKSNAPSLSKSGTPLGGLGKGGKPDLTVDSARLARSIQITSRNFKSTDCAVVEGCATPGKRKLLRFDVSVPNFGDADLYVGPVLGSPPDTARFVYDSCHKHWHYKDFSLYRLLNSDLSERVPSRKQAFCFIDVLRYWQGYSSNGYTCSNQGISVGWADLYDKSLDCQWIDVTGVAPGNYYVEVRINVSSNPLDEGSNSWPNTVRVPVTIRAGG